MSKKIKIGQKSLEKKLKERGWTQISPGVWQGQPIRPFIGPLTTEDQRVKDYYDKLFSDIVKRYKEEAIFT